MPKPEKITVTMHRALRDAAQEPDGRVDADNGVKTSLLRRGLAESKDGKVTITQLGRWAIDNAPLNPASRPTSMDQGDFLKYLATRGK